MAQVLQVEMFEKLRKLSKEMFALLPEFLLSSMVFVHYDIRNKLDPAKVSKLAFCLPASAQQSKSRPRKISFINKLCLLYFEKYFKAWSIFCFEPFSLFKTFSEEKLLLQLFHIKFTLCRKFD